MKIQLKFEACEIIVRLKDNSAVKQFITMLPADFKFRDYAGNEKITDFVKPISLKDTPRGMVATAGKMFIYVPWGNMGIFYKNHGVVLDRNLVELGEVEKGLDCLAAQEKSFTASINVIE